MTKTNGYGQFCPIAIAAEVMAQRWTPLVLRALFCGAARYSDIRASVPRMSTALLSQRLKELERAHLIERSASEGAGVQYRLTESGRALWPILEEMGAWAQIWLRRAVTADHNLDPDVLMWELRRLRDFAAEDQERRRVAKFQLSGVPIEKRFYWLVFEPDDTDICVKDPGFEVDIWVTAHLRALVEIRLGHATIAEAKATGALELDGAPAEIAAFEGWFGLSPFAKYGDARRAG